MPGETSTAGAPVVATVPAGAPGSTAATEPATPEAPAAPATPAADPAKAGDAPAGAEAKPDAGEVKYELKLPDGSPLDAAALERTAATARELGLSQDAAQKALELVNTEVTSRITAERDALLAAYSPGGDEWQKQVDGWKAETLADPALGKTPEERTASIESGKGLLRKYGEVHPADKEAMDNFLNTSGLGDHPAAAKFFAWLGKAMSEGTMPLTGGNSGGGSVAERLNSLYPSMAGK